MPIRVLTRKNSLISKESYKKIFDRTEANLYSDTPLGPGPYLKKKTMLKKIESSGVPIRLLTGIKIFQSYRWKHHGESLYKF